MSKLSSTASLAVGPILCDTSSKSAANAQNVSKITKASEEYHWAGCLVLCGSRSRITTTLTTHISPPGLPTRFNIHLTRQSHRFSSSERGVNICSFTFIDGL